MNIIEAPSPNYDERALPISLLILHYTGVETGEAALAHMRNPDAKVCAHYMVEEDGRVFQLADEDKRAWHAGISHWAGETDINSASIGIEIVNEGHDFGLPSFPQKQIDVVIKLSRDIVKRHKISDFNVLGHSDIAPARKQDPGERFPWDMLADAGVGIWPESRTQDRRALFNGDEQHNSELKIIQKSMAWYGYGIQPTGCYDEQTKIVITAFQRRYRPACVNGILDVETLEKLNILVRYKKKVEGVALVG